LGLVLYKIGDLKAAKENIDKTIEIYKEIYVPDNPWGAKQFLYDFQTRIDRQYTQ
jgi:hypothetical protein